MTAAPTSSPEVGLRTPSSRLSVDAVSLPVAGTGERRSRRDRRRRRRTRTALVLAGVGAAVLFLIGLAAFGWRSAQMVLDPDAGVAGDATVEEPAATEAVTGERAMVVQLGDAGQVVSITVVAVAEGGEGGDVVFLPVGTMVEVPSFGLNPLRDAHRDGGLPLLQSSIENLFGVGFGAVVAVDEEGLTALLSPAGPLMVDIPDAVERVTPTGRVEVLFGEGPEAVEPERVPALLAEPGGRGELDRLVRHEAVWRAWVAAVAADPAAGPPSTRAAGDPADVLAALAAGEVGYHLLPVEAVSSGLAADVGLFRVRGAQLEALLSRILPEAGGEGGPRIKVQVLNGTGVPGLAQEVQPVLVRVGAAVALTGNADRFDYEITQIVYYRDDRLEAARAIQRALGFGEVVRSLSGLDVVDVTVVVGQDFRTDRVGERAPRPDDGRSGGAATDE
ncbi:MAG TPA: LytR C-terminal domain-containing protein [Acidimicrobiales bacterium]|nr:LytR C-terminal domain-containing protein [Acidimicrobiales bacterium]